MKKQSLRTIVFLVFAAVLVLSSCTEVTPSPVSLPETPSAVTATGAQVVSTLAPVETQAPAASPTEAAPVSQATATPRGPLAPPPPDMWLVVNSAEGLVVIAPDASDSTPLGINILEAAADLQASPGGEWLAYRTGPDETYPFGLSLGLIRMPDGAPETITPLLSDDFQPAGSADRPAEAVIAVSLPVTTDWSPDGSLLAFVAALDGPSSDLYTYNMQTSQIVRLTDGPGETALPTFSPDGRWIVHEAVENFGTGAGWSVSAVWAAAADGTTVEKLYDISAGSGSEVFVGWTAPDTFVVYTWSAVGLTDLRLFNLTTKQATPVFAGGFDQVALDPASGTLVVMVGSYTVQEGQEAGLYLIAPGGQPVLAKAGEYTYVRWSPEGERFIAQNDQGSDLVTLTGETVSFPLESWGTISPDGQYVAFRGDPRYDPQSGLRIYDIEGNIAGVITTEPVFLITWRPDSDGFYFSTLGSQGNSLFYLHVPGGRPKPVLRGLLANANDGLAWVLPK